ncbi:MAG: glycosyltransferase family 9 protein [Acidobacteriaceae bacterium]|nr:glycosyltransferase family 9 protein [Acidobacteriaceae bacterium]
MASISAAELAQEVLDACLRDGTWPARTLDALIQRALDEDDPFAARAAVRALFGIVVERLADLFEPELCEVYARLFSYVIARALPEYDAADLLIRYRRIRQINRFKGGEIRRVFVLSRVTLGADVAVTSVVLSAAKSRFPNAEICLVGPDKNAEMFAADARIVPLPVTYGRSSLLRDRLAAAFELRSLVDESGTLVIDPDSRLTQLGLIPVCDDARYFFFESRAFGGELDTPLPDLTSEWLSEVFDVDRNAPYLAPHPQPRVADIAVSLGVGENDDKRLDDQFEFELVAGLLRTGKRVLIDRGSGGEETSRVNELAERLGMPTLLHLHDGSYASFASHILHSSLYVGYDSAGQHVAAAGNVPLLSIFAGYACDRMFSRWRPVTSTSHVIRVDHTSRARVLEEALRAVDCVMQHHG